MIETRKRGRGFHGLLAAGFLCSVSLLAPVVLPACGGENTVEVPSPETAGMEVAVLERIEQERAIVSSQPTASSWGRLAMVFHAHGLVEESLESYGRAMALDPSEFRWPYLAARALHGLEPDRSRAELERALKLNPQYVPALLLLGDLHESAGDIPSAFESYEKARALDPDSAAALFALGRLTMRQGDLDEGASLMMRAGEIQPYAGAIHAFLARAYRKLGREKDARSSAERAARLDPEVVVEDPLLNVMNGLSVSTLGLQGRIKRAEATGELGLAESLHRDLVRRHHEDVGMHFNFANLLNRAGKPDEAASMYEKALELDREFVPALVNYGNALMASGQLEEALGLLKRAVELEPERASALVSISNAHAKLGNVEAAMEPLASVLAQDADHVQALQGMALLLGERGRLAEALGFAERALVASSIETSPRTLASAHALNGDLLARAGRFAEAWFHIHESQRLGLEIPEAFIEELRNLFPEPPSDPGV